MNKEDNYVKNRLLDLADITYSKNIYAYSDFLNLNEINILNKEETFKKLIGEKINNVKGNLIEKEKDSEIKTTTTFTFTTEEKEEIKLSIEFKNKNTLGSINKDILRVFISFTALEDLF